MIGGKADKEEVQGLKKMLADKVNLADHQVCCPIATALLFLTVLLPRND